MDGLENPLQFILTGGQEDDITRAVALLEEAVCHLARKSACPRHQLLRQSVRDAGCRALWRMGGIVDQRRPGQGMATALIGRKGGLYPANQTA